MTPLHFKLMLTGWLGFAVVMSVFSQLFNAWMLVSGKVKKFTFYPAWMVNTFLIYGIWKWL